MPSFCADCSGIPAPQKWGRKSRQSEVLGLAAFAEGANCGYQKHFWLRSFRQASLRAQW